MRTMLHGEAVIRAASHVKAFDHCVSTPRVQVSCTLMGRCENTEGLSCALTDTVRAFVRIHVRVTLSSRGSVFKMCRVVVTNKW